MRPSARSLLLLTCLLTPAPACHVLELTSAGFATNVLQVLHALPFFHAPERGPLYLDSAAFHHKCNHSGGWHDFFRPLEGFRPWTRHAAEKLGGACQRLDFIRVDMENTNVQATHMELEHVALHRAWHYQPWVQREVDQILRDVANFTGPSVAFHARGGDASTFAGAADEEVESLYEEEEEFEEPSQDRALVDHFLRSFPGQKVKSCLVLGDDRGAVARTAKLAEELLGCHAVKRAAFPNERGYFQDEFHQADLGTRCQSTLELIKDLEVFAAADFFIGSYDSAVTRLAESLRFCLRGKERRTFADASPQHLDWFEAVREFFREQEQRHHLG